MRSLLTLTFSFALLAAYLEWVAPATQPQASSSQLSKIVRAQRSPSAQQVARIENTPPNDDVSSAAAQPMPIISKALRVLNLKLPTGAITDSSALHIPAQLVLSSSEPNPANKIRYNAELVYDLDKGEDITGGKVNIEIPFG